MKHTKGPWNIDGGGSPGGGKYLIIRDKNDVDICEVSHTYNNHVTGTMPEAEGGA